MKRRQLSRRQNQKKYRQGNKTSSMNLQTRNMRGGIRLT